jgi:hypothetical protein
MYVPEAEVLRGRAIHTQYPEYSVKLVELRIKG